MQYPRPLRALRCILGSVILLCGAVAACTSATPPIPRPSPTTATPPSPPPPAPSTTSTTSTAPPAEPVTWTTRVAVPGASLAVSVRGDDPALPILLVIHGGPGFAMIDLLHTRTPALEHDFVVVSYDQRGAGLSYAADVKPRSLTLARFVDDADAVRAAVLAHLGRPADRAVYVLGHSMGTMIGLELVQRFPTRYAGYIGVGQVVQVAANEQGSYDFALAQARRAGHRAAIAALTCVGRPTDDFAYPGPTDDDCDEDADGFDVTNQWLGYFGGDVYGQTSADAIEAEILASPAYAGRTRQWTAGTELSARLFDDPAVTAWDARVRHRDAPVPLYFFMGRHDADTPAALAAAYSATIRGPHRLVWFEQSAHFPFYEEPARFAQRLRAILDGTLRADE